MNTRILPRLAVVVILLLVVVQIAHAQIPRTISYQGKINQGATPLTGTHLIHITFYDSETGGTALYEESHQPEFIDGLFSIIIGSVTPIPDALAFDRQYYLGITIDGGQELLPRTKLTSTPYALNSHIAELAQGLTSDAHGVVTSINEVSGPVRIIGDTTTSISQTGNTITIHSVGGSGTGGSGIQSISSPDKTIAITGSNGPLATVGVADSAITTAKLANKSVTLAKLNQSGAKPGQTLRWNGTSWIAVDTSIGGMNSGTLSNSTLRWDGTQWRENKNLLSDATGNTTIKGSSTIGDGSGADDILLQPGTGLIKVQNFNQGVVKSTAVGNLFVGTVDLANEAVGILPVVNGGTGLNNLPSGQLLVGNGTSPIKTITLKAGPGIGIITSPGFLTINNTDTPQWKLLGNLNVDPATQFLGTTDGNPLVIRTNNLERLRVDGAGRVGIGTSTPSQLVEVKNGSVLISNSSNAGSLMIAAPGSTLTTAFTTSGQGSNIIYKLPGALGAANDVLTISSINGTTATLGWMQSNSNTDWKLTGNTNTVAGTNFLGTTDNAALDFRVNNVIRLRMNQNYSLQHDIGGNVRGANSIDFQVSRTASTQVASGDNSVITGGINNTVAGRFSFVGGGTDNNVLADASVVSGGGANSIVASGGYSSIGGGLADTISGAGSAIAGGQYNKIYGNLDAIPGGYGLTLTGNYAFGYLGDGPSFTTVSASNTAFLGNVNLWLGNINNTPSELRFYEAQNGGGTFPAATTNFSALKAGAQTADLIYTLPLSQPTLNQVLSATAVSGTGPYNVSLGWVDGGTNTAWNLTGNSGTAAGTNFLGTIDNQPFEIHIYNGYGTANQGTGRAFRIEPTTGSQSTPNIIGGYGNGPVPNTIQSGKKGSVIAGGGASGSINYIQGDYGFIGGGTNNHVQGNLGVIGGGNSNATGANDYQTVVGGYDNQTNAIYSGILGGSGNRVNAASSIIGGGDNNVISTNAAYSGILGGLGNTVSGFYSSIAGGRSLTLSGSGSFGFFGNNVANDRPMSISANYTSVFGNTDLWLANNDNAARQLRFYEANNQTGGGSFPPTGINFSSFQAGAQSSDIFYTLPLTQPTANQVLSATAVSGSGPYNISLGWADGSNLAWNLAGNGGTTAGTNFLGTTDNKSLDIRTNNIIRLRFNTNNSIQRDVSGPSAGSGSIDLQAIRSSAQTNSGDYSTIGGGEYNTADNLAATVGGGYSNYASGAYSTISGGYANYITGQYSAIPGGTSLTLGSYSFGFHSGTGPGADLSSFAGVVYFGNATIMIGNADNAARELRFYEPNSSSTFSGANFSGFKAGTQAADLIYTLPTSQPATNQVLSATAITGSGPYNVTLGWADAGGSGFVNYGPTSVQATLTPRTTPLFNIAYISTAADANAAGATITSSAGAAGNLSATALTLVANATGTGLARAVNATGRINIDNPSSYDIGGNRWLWMGPSTDATVTMVGNTGNSTNTGSLDVFVGSNAGHSNIAGHDNVAVGPNALKTNTSGYNNVAIGSGALLSNTNASDNIAIGDSALLNNTTGLGSIAIGTSALQFVTTVGVDIAIGYRAARSITSGEFNTVIGDYALQNDQTGSNNTVLGYAAASAASIGPNRNTCTFLGAYTNFNSTLSLTNASAIGARAYVDADNSMVLGSINGVNQANADTKVGIGTITPQQKFNVENGNILLSRTGTNGVDSLTFQGTGTGISSFAAGAQGTTNINYTLPVSQPTANQVLSATAVSGSGPYSVTLGWANSSGSAWNLTGNSGTTAGTNFIGTTDNQALDLRSNNILRFRLNTNNSIQRDNAGNTRGIEAIDLQASRNVASMVASGDYSVISGGSWNTASGTRSAVIGGTNSVATNNEAIAGGYNNSATGVRSVAIGGEGNFANGTYSFSGGGLGNTVGGQSSVILGGADLTLSGDYTFGFNSFSGGSSTMNVSASNVAVFGNVDIWLANTRNSATQLKFFEAQSSNGTFPAATTNFSSFKAGTQSADINYTLPTSQPSANQVLVASAVSGSGPYNVTLNWANDGVNAWNLTGNSGTTPGTNFIGTTDNQDMVVKTNNAEAMRITGGGKVGIGTSSPQKLLHVIDNSGANTVYIENNNNSTTPNFQAALTVTNLTTTAGAPTEIAFKHNNSSSATFTGAVIDMYPASMTSGSEQGHLVFATRENGSSTGVIEKMRITATGQIGIGTSTPSHELHVVNTATTDEMSSVYGNTSGATSNQAIGVWGDASNTATSNTGTIGVLATGNGNTTAGQTNIALQVNDGEFTMGRTTEAPGTGNVVSTATGGTAYSAQGPSGIVELTLGNGNLATAAPTANTTQNFAAITINNRYCQAGSIVLVNIVGMTDDGNAPDPRDAAFIANVDNTAAGSFSVRIKMIPSATNASNYTSNDKVKIGYVIVNASR